MPTHTSSASLLSFPDLHPAPPHVSFTTPRSALPPPIPSPFSPTSHSTSRRSPYTPLLSTLHQRHSLMKSRIQQRWSDAVSQLSIMRRELRARAHPSHLPPTRAQTAQLLGVDAPLPPAGSPSRRDVARVAVRVVEEGGLTVRQADVLRVHGEDDEGEREAQGGRRRLRGDAFPPSSFGLHPGPSPDPSPPPTPHPPDAYAVHSAQWDAQCLRPVFSAAPPTTNGPSPSPSQHDQPLTPADPSPVTAAPTRPLTPRRAYSVYLSSTIKNLVALLMQLDKQAMAHIRSSFSHHPEGLDLYTFVLIASTYMRSCVGSKEDIAALIEMFRDIDVNGDEVMEWDEFTSHLVQLASTYGEDTTSSQLPHFTPSMVEDTSTHDRVCDVVRYIPALKRCVLFERNSRRFKLYSPHDIKPLCTVRGHRSPLLACEYWEKGGMLITASADKTLIFWQWTSPTTPPTMSMSWTLPASYVALRYAGGHTLFAADTCHSITQWHLERSEQRCVYRGHTDVVMDMVVLHHYNLLASCSLDTTVRLWDIGKGVEVSIMKGHTKPATLLAYHPDLKLLISAGMDRFALVWNPRVLAPVYTIQCASPLSHIVGLEVLGGSPELVIGDSKGCFMVYDLRSFSVIQQFSIPNLTLEQQLHSFTVVHTQGLLLAAGAKLYQFKRTTGVRRHHADDNAVRFASFNATRLTFITVAADNIKVWNALTGRLEREEKNFTQGGITSVCVDDLQRRIYVGCTDGAVYCLNYSSGAIMCRLQVHRTEVSALAYHPTMKAVVSGSWDASVCLSDDKLTAVSKRIHSHTEDVLHVQTSAHFSLIASAAADLTVSLHDTHLGPPLLKWHLDHLPSALLFLDPYPLLLVGDHSGGLSLFDTTSPYRRTAVTYIPAFSRVPAGDGIPVGSALHRSPSSPPLGAEWAAGEGHEGSRTSVINAMCFVPRTSTLYTGDDAGYIKAWSLTALLSVFRRRPAGLPTPAPPKAQVGEGGEGVAGAPAIERHVSMMEGTRTGAGQRPGATPGGQPRSILRTPASPRPLPKQVSLAPEAGVETEEEERSPSPPSPDTGEWDEEEAGGGVGLLAVEDCRLLTAEVAREALGGIGPGLIVRAHEDSCSGLSYIPRACPDPALLSFSFDGSVVLTSAVSGAHLGALMQGHNSRSEEREEGKEWGFEYDLVWHRMKELEMMREGLRGGRGKGSVDWLREEDEEDGGVEGEGEGEEGDAATVDRRMMTPTRERQMQEREQRRGGKAAAHPALPSLGQGGRVGSAGGRPHARQSIVHVQRLPAVSFAGGARPQTGGRLWVGGQYMELSESQTAAGEGLERRLKGEGGEEKEQLGMVEEGGRTKRAVGPGLASMYGNWEGRDSFIGPAVVQGREDGDDEA